MIFETISFPADRNESHQTMQSSFEDASLLMTSDYELTVENVTNSLPLTENPWSTAKEQSRTFTSNRKIQTLEHTFSSPSKLSPVPTSTHPLNHDITTPPVPPFFSGIGKENEAQLSIRQRRGFAPLGNENDRAMNLQSHSSRNRRSFSDISDDTNDKSSLGTGKDRSFQKKYERKTVIVHEVKPSDTLVGIALFYGIELPVLKRANKLWTSDSIHMHKYLYIPLDDCALDQHEETVSAEGDCIKITKHRSSASTSSIPSPLGYYEPGSSFPVDSCNCFYPTGRRRKMSNVSTATIWSTASLGSSPSSPTSNTSGGILSTSVEIQKLPTAQLSYFPPHRSKFRSVLATRNSNSLSSSPSKIITPSPVPVSHHQRNKQNNSISLPIRSSMAANDLKLSMVEKLFTTLDIASEKYLHGSNSAKPTRRRRSTQDGSLPDLPLNSKDAAAALGNNHGVNNSAKSRRNAWFRL